MGYYGTKMALLSLVGGSIGWCMATGVFQAYIGGGYGTESWMHVLAIGALLVVLLCFSLAYYLVWGYSRLALLLVCVVLLIIAIVLDAIYLPGASDWLPTALTITLSLVAVIIGFGANYGITRNKQRKDTAQHDMLEMMTRTFVNNSGASFHPSVADSIMMRSLAQTLQSQTL